jgi:hypothetical protein
VRDLGKDMELPKIVPRSGNAICLKVADDFLAIIGRNLEIYDLRMDGPVIEIEQITDLYVVNETIPSLALFPTVVDEYYVGFLADIRIPDGIRNFLGMRPESQRDGQQTMAFAVQRNHKVAAISHTDGISVVSLENGGGVDVENVPGGRAPIKSSTLIFHENQPLLTFLQESCELISFEPKRKFW